MCPNANDATSWWRAAGPFSHLQRTGMGGDWEIALCRVPDIGWSDLSGFDALFLQRPHQQAHARVITKAQELGLKVWIDYDDDLSALPASNPAFSHYADPQIKKTIAKIASQADVISVSTKALEDKMKTLNPETVLIPNAWNDLIVPKRRPNGGAMKLILWRGSATHDQDLDLYLDQMQQVADKYPDWKWIFIGKPFWKVADKIKKHLIMEPMDVPKYMNVIGEIRPAIAIVPLVFNAFNESKSNIGWQEGTYAGACAVVPNMHEWQRPGAIHYTQETFAEALTKAISLTPHDRKRLVDQSWAQIMENENLVTVNLKRKEILERLK